MNKKEISGNCQFWKYDFQDHALYGKEKHA
jgi:hypothetical protein